MLANLDEDALAVYRRAMTQSLAIGSPASLLMDRQEIESFLPHRDPFLFLDEIVGLNLETHVIVARYDLAKAETILSGHFPGSPIFPGVLQIEAIGQAGCVLILRTMPESRLPSVLLTHIYGARFLRRVVPGTGLEITVQLMGNGLLYTLVGQCRQGETICCVAAMGAIEAERSLHD